MNAEHYIECAKLSKDLVIDRRKLQWRINYIVWAAQGAVAYHALANEGFYRDLGSLDYNLVRFALIVTPLVFIFVHILPGEGSNRKDLDLLSYFREKARQEIGDPNCPTDVEFPEDITDFSLFYALKCRRWKHWHCLVLPICISIILFGADMLTVGHARRSANGGLPRHGTREAAAAVDAPAVPAPAPAAETYAPGPPSAPSTEQTSASADLLAEVAARAARADTTYRTTITTVLMIVSFGGIIVTAMIFVLETVSLRHRKDEIDAIRDQVQALQAEAKTQAGAAVSATKALRQEAFVLYGNLANTYFHVPEPLPDIGFVMVTNAAEAADLAGAHSDNVVGPLHWWLGRALRHSFKSMVGLEVDPSLRDSWLTLMEVETRRKEPEFTVAADAMRQFVRDFVGAESLKKMLAGHTDVMAQPESPQPDADAPGGATPADN